MKRILIVTILMIATFLFSSLPVSANFEAVSSADIMPELKTDLRAERLKKFLLSYDSPLAKYAKDFVETADKYGVDWKLVPAITGVESTFGKAIPAFSYNAYGWANGAYYFNSWEDSINIVNKTLKENYLDRGAKTVEQIALIYAPPSQTWTWKVKYFMDKLENFTVSNPLALELSL